jgi:hypothetical protein
MHRLRMATGHPEGPLQRVPVVPEAPRPRQGPAEVQRGWERAIEAFDLKDWR